MCLAKGICSLFPVTEIVVETDFQNLAENLEFLFLCYNLVIYVYYDNNRMREKS